MKAPEALFSPNTLFHFSMKSIGSKMSGAGRTLMAWQRPFVVGTGKNLEQPNWGRFNETVWAVIYGQNLNR
jgi:hypothetical protein